MNFKKSNLIDWKNLSLKFLTILLVFNGLSSFSYGQSSISSVLVRCEGLYTANDGESGRKELEAKEKMGLFEEKRDDYKIALRIFNDRIEHLDGDLFGVNSCELTYGSSSQLLCQENDWSGEQYQKKEVTAVFDIWTGLISVGSWNGYGEENKIVFRFDFDGYCKEIDGPFLNL